MTLALALVGGVFVGSILVARWQFSEARELWRFLWYRHWKMRERHREFRHRMFQQYPRFMRWWYRVQTPLHHERVWAVRMWWDKHWFNYASWWVPKCKVHGCVMHGRICLACVAAESARREMVKVMAGHGDPARVETNRWLERLWARKDGEK